MTSGPLWSEKNPHQTACCLVPQDFTGLWKLNSSHWLVSTMVKLCLLWRQELAMSRDCPLCCNVSFLIKTFRPLLTEPSSFSSLNLTPDQADRVVERSALLSMWYFSPLCLKGCCRKELHQAAAGEKRALNKDETVPSGTTRNLAGWIPTGSYEHLQLRSTERPPKTQ